MAESNPYEAPRSALSNSRDKLLATRMLALRERDGYSLGLFLRWNATRYVIRSVYFAGAVLFFVTTGLWILFYFMLGLLVGICAQDLGWVLAHPKGVVLHAQGHGLGDSPADCRRMNPLPSRLGPTVSALRM